MKIQKCVYDKIEQAFNEFKEEMLKNDPEEIFEKAYKIACITEIYDILYNSYEFSPYGAEIILEFKGNILEQVYDEWLRYDNGIRDELESSIGRTFILLWKVVARYA